MAKRFKLPNKGWGDPLRKLREDVTKYFQGGKQQSLSFAVSDCSRYYRYLTAIWRRLMTDFELYDTYWSMMEKYIGKVEGRLELEPRDALTLNTWIQNAVYLYLDYEDFFIYTRILMDKLAYLTSFFFVGPSPRSFNKQKKFFLKSENIPFSSDEEYANYIREKTDWFERSLKLARDKLIVHGLPFVGGVKASPNGTITLPRIGWGRDLQNVWEKLKALKEKYENRYPELKGVSDNIFEITKFLLDRPNIVLEPTDREIFFQCVEIAGSELPDISPLADNLIEFVEFFGRHFAKKMDER